jgi:ATP-dependent RNA helicase RhlE
MHFSLPIRAICFPTLKDSLMKFEELGLAETLLRAVSAEGYTTATAIQAAAIPPVLEGRDVLGCAQTGTGKTAAFALPTLHRLGLAETRVNGRGRKIRALILAPTRELVIQIAESFRVYGKHTSLRSTVIYGGVGQGPQVKALNNGVDIVAATPGRLLDLMQQGYVDLSQVQTLVLDEADRMLDMGFVHDLKRIVAKAPAKRQTLLFSATMPPAIRQLADQWLVEPVTVKIGAESRTADKIKQSVYHVDQEQKTRLLTELLAGEEWKRSLVFTRTKHRADRIAKFLEKSGISADAFHSDKSQSSRQKILARFKSPKPVVLVATDIAARGLDIDMVSHVINYDLPADAENYVHRIGRTGRAGAEGVAVSFCDGTERSALKAIERVIKQTIAVEKLPEGMPAPTAPAPSAKASGGRPRGRSGYSRGGHDTRPAAAGGTSGASGHAQGARKPDHRRKVYAGRK